MMNRRALIRDAKAQSDLNATSIVTYAENLPALARKIRLGNISSPEFSRCKVEFERDWPDFERIPLSHLTVQRAGQLAETCRLRGFDAIHLASPELLQTAVGIVTFACFDAELSRAAALCGMTPLSFRRSSAFRFAQIRAR